MTGPDGGGGAVEAVGVEVVTLTVDGKEVTVPSGTLIIRAAEELGIEIPRFCDHPLLDPVAACRQCYVSVEGQRKLMTSCSTPVADGMAVHTQFTDPAVKDAQESVLEFLLINHPLDCPVCDRGGECPLQDQALAFGPGETRYVEAKRTYRKPLPLSPLVNLDRERCVLCARCTRFCDQISGDRFIELFDRGAAEQVAIAPGEDFRSPFSGNTIQICPVGALTATSYRFAARPFDLKSGDSICPHCACGCNLRVDLRRGEVVRHLARDNDEVNEAWLCDKGRFAFRFADRSPRLTTPLLRDRGLERVSFGEALGAVARWCEGGPVAFLAGGRLSDEDAYVLSKLARTVFGTNDLDHRWGGAGDLPLDVEAAQASGAPVTYRDIERAKLILLVGLDAEQELPILHLRVRKAVRRGATAFVVHPRRTRLWDVAGHLPCRPGGEAELVHGLPDADPETMAGRLWAALQEAAGDAVVLAGHRLATSSGAVAELAQMAEAVGARFAMTCRRANDRGALRGGVHPALLPGGRALESEDDRAPVEVAWGTLLPDTLGRDTGAILEAAAKREIEVLFLVGVDPLRDFPDAELARRALENVRYKVVVDVAGDAMDTFADAMLPALPSLEKDGHYTDWEGRSQRLRPVRDPDGLGRSEWEIFQELSVICGHDLGFSSLDALHEEMGRLLWSGPGSRATAAGAGRDEAAAVDGRQPVRSPSARLTGAQTAYAPLPEPAKAPPSSGPDAGGPEPGQLLLFTYPLLVDDGRLALGADELEAALGQKPFVEVHPSDAARLGLVDGETATVRTGRGEARLPVRVTAGIVEGCVFVPYNQPGFAANSILSGSPTTPATLEPLAAAVGVS